ncbi:SHOCT domain-containing protein [Micropruina sp.]|uniref:SHOCT domain-containing protein n=1 Tax=Micropruina sp. TaxID=2737536 RepID=UPI00261E94B3|nr:SHOCT domain-containing protein [Micropruina sp.]
MPEFWSNLGSTVWYVLTLIIFISYLFALFSIIGDVLRDRSLSGGLKAVWVICLVFFPLLTALVYLIVRGGGMAERAAAQAQQNKAAADDYIRSVAGSPSDEIARAKALLDAGTISQPEYDKLKAKALS